MIDLTLFFAKQKTIAELVAPLTKADLYTFTDEIIAAERALIADATDADVVFVASDPEAPEGIGWTLGHVAVHVTASSEEAAAQALTLARGVLPTGRSRYETPWETVTTVAQVSARLTESHRMRHAMLDAWPDAPQLDIVWTHPFFGEVNAIGYFITGLGHDYGQLAQLGEIARQARAARGA